MSGETHGPPDCVKLPPVQATYEPKGSYQHIGEYKTYVSGPLAAKGAVMIIYDAFGIIPQILQGADLIASQGFKVYMPDVFHGEGFQMDWSNEKKEQWGKTVCNISNLAAPVSQFIGELNKRNPGNVSAAGFCWGWRMLGEIANSVDLKAVAGCHPWGAEATDAEVFKMPICLLPSSGEDMDVMNKIYEGREKALPGKNFLRLFDKSPHGWMAGRAKLDDPESVELFTEGYQCLVEFFSRDSGH